MLTLHTIHGKIKKKKKRVGRGNASGHGTTATRGTKGQRARSGTRRGILRRLGMRQSLLQFPKLRGFKSARGKSLVLSCGDLQKQFADGATVGLVALRKNGWEGGRVKILAGGKLSKKLHIVGIPVSAGARSAILAAGGTISESVGKTTSVIGAIGAKA